MPIDSFLKVGESWRDRLLTEVMGGLYNSIGSTIILEDKGGTICDVVKFYPPDMKENKMTYGFDVKFPDDHIVNHLEFSVECTGWEIKCQ